MVISLDDLNVDNQPQNKKAYGKQEHYAYNRQNLACISSFFLCHGISFELLQDLAEKLLLKF